MVAPTHPHWRMSATQEASVSMRPSNVPPARQRAMTTTRGVRRFSPRVYKFLLTTHVVVSVGWLGITAAKLVLGLVAVLTGAPDRADGLYAAMGAINVAFPPVAIATLVTGVLLSLGTKWGLVRHYWVATKIALTVAVIVTAVQLEDRFVRQPLPTLSGRMEAGTFLGSEPLLATLLLFLPVAHLLMLLVATVLSVYKPWGKTAWGRRTVRPSRENQDRRDARLADSATQ
jgi:hypothetical protein